MVMSYINSIRTRICGGPISYYRDLSREARRVVSLFCIAAEDPEVNDFEQSCRRTIACV